MGEELRGIRPQPLEERGAAPSDAHYGLVVRRYGHDGPVRPRHHLYFKQCEDVEIVIIENSMRLSALGRGAELANLDVWVDLFRCGGTVSHTIIVRWPVGHTRIWMVGSRRPVFEGKGLAATA